MVPVYASNNTLTEHYLEIQALSVADPNPPADPGKTPGQATAFFPVFFIIILFIGVFGWQFYSRLRDLNRIMMILAIGLFVGMVPLTVNVITSKSTSTATKATTDYTPQTVVVSDVGLSSFKITWRTQVPTRGAVRFSTARDMKTNLVVLRNAERLLVHSFVLDNLNPGSTYFVELMSDSLWYNHNQQPISITTNR